MAEQVSMADVTGGVGAQRVGGVGSAPVRLGFQELKP